jgi:hypothetical protein
MFLTNRHLDRRTFLRGMGATVALPLLDAMIPARASAAAPVPRLAFVYFPHGAIMDQWTPATSGRAFELGRILEPLARDRNRLTIVSGLENRHAYGPVHAITPGTWLSGTSPRRSGEASPKRGRKQEHVTRGATADQLAADHLGQQTRLPFIAVAMEEPRAVGAGIWQGEYGESYGTTISFRQADVPAPMEFQPRAVFDTLFCSTPARGASDSTSVLDRVDADLMRLRKRLGPVDRVALGDYLEAIRDVEQRVDRLRPESFGGPAGQSVSEPPQADVARQFKERMALMFDMIALAFRADITRVASVMMAAEASAMTYDHLGVPDAFHLLSHHQNDPEKIEKLIAIQAFHTRMFATFVRTLAALPDGDGSILDRSLILFGSNMSNSHAHDHFPLPLAVIGGGCGTHRGGQHLRYPDRTPMSNLLLTILHRAGVAVPSVGDSTCECDEL